MAATTTHPSHEVSLALPAVLAAANTAIDRWPAVLIAIPVMGVLQNRLFILHHEGAHRLLFTNGRWNDLIGVRWLHHPRDHLALLSGAVEGPDFGLARAPRGRVDDGRTDGGR